MLLVIQILPDMPSLAPPQKKTYHVGIIIVWYYKFFKQILDFENNQVFLQLGHVLTFLTVARKAQ